jgi:hypothetical protein
MLGKFKFSEEEKSAGKTSFLKKLFHTLIILLGIGIILGVVVFLFRPSENGYATENTKAAEILKDLEADIYAAKFLGDDIVNNVVKPGPKEPNFTDVQGQAADDALAVQSMSTPESISEFAGAVQGFGITVANNASSNTPSRPSRDEREGWKQYVPNDPMAFKANLADGEIKRIIADSLKDLSSTREFGNWAVANKDRKTMRYLAGKYSAYIHLFKYLAPKQSSSFLNIEVEAAAIARLSCYPKEGDRKINTCIGSLGNSLQGLARASRNFSVGAPGAEEEWQNAVESKPIALLQGKVITGVGITDDKGQPVPPTALENFRTTCGATGGTMLGGGVKERLPTTANGDTCWHHDGGETCWEYMTYSGNFYQGGEAGCPEQGLVPKVVPQVPTINTEDGQVRSWDGTYQQTSSSASCGTYGYSYAQGFVPGSYVVRNNGVILGDSRADIGADGRAVLKTVVQGLSLEFVLDFTNINGQAYIQGFWNASGFGASCEGRFAAQRV